TGTVDFATQGALKLTATATSRTNPSIAASASAALTIPPTSGLTAALSPDVQVVPVPGKSTFLVTVNNTGNTDDSFTLAITGTNGPVPASLMSLDGLPTQSIPTFILPALSTGRFVLQTNLSDVGQGTVDVQVKSLTAPARSKTVSAITSTP